LGLGVSIKVVEVKAQFEHPDVRLILVREPPKELVDLSLKEKEREGGREEGKRR